MITTVTFHLTRSTDINVKDIYPTEKWNQNITVRIDPNDYHHQNTIHIHDKAAAQKLIEAIRYGIELIREKEKLDSKSGKTARILGWADIPFDQEDK